MRNRDLLLIAVALAGIGGGVALPGPAGLFSPYVLYFMMTILFLSFLRIDFSALLNLSAGPLFEVAAWSTIKLLAMTIRFFPAVSRPRIRRKTSDTALT